MDVDKIYKLHDLLNGRRTVISAQQLALELQCSQRNIARYIRFMREQFSAPLDYDREYQGYRYSHERFELPGLWFSTEEILALVTLQKLMADLGTGLLDQQLSPLKSRIEKLLQAKHLGAGEMQRIKLLPIAIRALKPEIFQQVASALLQRKQLQITYHARGDNQQTTRLLSPQRLVHYRGNWHLDAWCHQKKSVRNFSLDGISHICLLQTAAENIPESELDAHFAQGYGIFAGAARHTAILRFSAYRARWVAAEIWHPKQQTRWLDDGSYELEFPYADPRELIGDIMRHLPEVEVIAPPELKQTIKERLQQALQKFE